MNEQKIPSVGDWIITLLLVSIPLVNIIALIYWAASGSIGSIKRNLKLNKSCHDRKSTFCCL
jgi:hypothetical protein